MTDRAPRLAIGIDPGVSGGVALLTETGDLVDVRDMPTLPSGPAGRDEISAHGLAAIIREWQPARAFVELIGPMPHDGAKAAFNFGVSKATILATLAVLEVPVDLIAPAVWKRHAKIPPGKDADPKGAARVEATRRWPARADLFRRVKDHGRAESALIGACGLARGQM